MPVTPAFERIKQKDHGTRKLKLTHYSGKKKERKKGIIFHEVIKH